MTEHNPVEQAELHTPDWLRSFEGCEHYSDEEATAILHSLDILAEILITAGERTSSGTVTTIIPLSNNLNKKAA